MSGFIGWLHDWWWMSSLLFLLVIVGFGYWAAPFFLWSILIFLILILFNVSIWWLLAFVAVSFLFIIKPIRSVLFSALLLKIFKNFMPKISKAERAAINSGQVWIEGDFFSGRPDFSKLLQVSYPRLTEDEKAFLNGPVEILCNMIDDWKVWQARELSQEVWDYIKQNKFLGMIIPKQYGGLQFSALAHSEVIQKLSSHSLTAATTVMVPNSLGPAELLIHYGTHEQKRRLLPRLAEGIDIPCLALTEPTAGSDAGSIKSEGIIFKDESGELKIRIQCEKRYITLASIATLIGLAFHLRDPENFLNKGEDIGITIVLIPATTSGLKLGLRHDPMGIPFYNCPLKGENVVVSVDDIIGGLDRAGEGWTMLMECLVAGRGISLPAQSVGGEKLITRVVSAHAVIRKQFGVSIGSLEGVEEPLAKIAGFNYMLDAMRHVTCGAIDKGIKPPVVTAIAKLNSTEIFRQSINHAMDILGGNAISLGPRNLLAKKYISSPIAITVEGANILTRTMIIFGQAAIIAHPYIYKEILAIEKRDVQKFDLAFWGHVGHFVQVFFRAIVLSITRGAWAAGYIDKNVRSYFRKLSWASAVYAFLSDVTMFSLGKNLKQREKIAGRFADILSWMYIGFSVLKRYEAEGCRKDDLPFVHFSMKYSFTQMQNGFVGIFENFKVPGLTWLFRGPIRWWAGFNSFTYSYSDSETHQMAQLLQTNFSLRERMTEGIFVPSKEGLGRLEKAMRVCVGASEALEKVRKAIRQRILTKGKVMSRLDEAVSKGVISTEELNKIMLAEDLRLDAIQVDSFTEQQFLSRSFDTTSLSEI